MEGSDLIAAWRATINGPGKSWVLFENGTCVILMVPETDLASQATALLGKWGPVGVGSSFGDFSTIELDDGRGWVVACHHPDILTFVGMDEIGVPTPEVAIGLLGRLKRGQDAEQLRVLHIEDRRAASA